MEFCQACEVAHTRNNAKALKTILPLTLTLTHTLTLTLKTHTHTHTLLTLALTLTLTLTTNTHTHTHSHIANECSAQHVTAQPLKEKNRSLINAVACNLTR